MTSPLRKHDRRSFYKYVTFHAALCILSARKLRWSSPLLFNDPFDVPREVLREFSADEMVEEFFRQFSSVVYDGAPTADPRSRVLQEIWKRAGRPAIRSELEAELRETAPELVAAWNSNFGEFERVWSAMIPTMRIFCVSATNASLPMWAHYADQHQGVVLEFAADDELDSALLAARPVRYQDAPPSLISREEWARKIAAGEKLDTAALLAEYHYVKSTDWKYENEWRVISFARGETAQLFEHAGFDSRELLGVYAGAQMLPEQREALLGALGPGYEHVQVHAAHTNQQSRHLDFHRVR